MASKEGITSSSFTFHPFPRLPPELRHQIWLESMIYVPDPPAVWFYGNIREIPPGQELSSDSEDEDEDEDLDPDLLVRFDLYVPIRSPPPQLFVNREARDIALSWAREKGRVLRFCKETQNSVLCRQFNLALDTVYVPYSKWEQYCKWPGYISWRPDDDDFVEYHEIVARVAIPQAVLHKDSERLIQLLSIEARRPRAICIVYGAPPDLDASETNMLVSRRWEVEGAHGKGGTLKEYRWEETPGGGSYSWDGQMTSEEVIKKEAHDMWSRLERAIVMENIWYFPDPITGEQSSGAVEFEPVIITRK